MAKQRIAFMLCRISTPEQSLESQENMLLQIAEDAGFHVPQEFIFREQKTGYDDFDDDRRSIVELRNAIILNKPEAIFCLELSRMSRNAIKLQKYIYEFSVNPKIPLYFGDYDMWTINPTTGDRIDENILKLIGAAEHVQKERERIRERTMRGRKSAASKGRYTGHLADGYKVEVNKKFEKEIKIDENRAPIIKRIFELYLNHSTNEVRDILNAEHIPTTNKYRSTSSDFNYKLEHKNKTGDTIKREQDLWTGNSVRQILKNQWYIGKRSFMGVDYPVEAIIDNETWQSVQEKLRSYPIIVKKGKNQFLLKDLLYCSCGRKMYGHFQGLNNHYYCSSAHAGKQKCKTRGISKENAESILHQVIHQRLIYQVFNDAYTEDESPLTKLLQIDRKSLENERQKIVAYKGIIEDTEEQIEEKRRQLRKTRLLIIESKSEEDDIEYRNEKLRIEREIKELEKRINEYNNAIRRINRGIETRKSAKTIVDKVADCTLEEFREFLCVAIEKITLFNANKTTSILRVDYANGEREEVIYSPQRYKDRYMLLTKRSYTPTLEDKLNSDLSNWRMLSIYLDEYMHDNVRYDEYKQKIVFEGKGIYQSGNVAFIVCKELYRERKEILKDKYDITLQFNEIEDEVDVDTFLSMFINDLGHSYQKTIISTDRADEIREYHKTYRKKYNTGKPSSEPYINRDELYEEINAKRKRLYNKIYKIKQKKTLSDKEKNEQIRIIKKQLKELRLQINYKKESDRALKILHKLRKTE